MMTANKLRWIERNCPRAYPATKAILDKNVCLGPHALKQNNQFAHNGARNIALTDIIATIRSFDRCYYIEAGYYGGKKYNFFKTINGQRLVVGAAIDQNTKGELVAFVNTAFDQNNNL